MEDSVSKHGELASCLSSNQLEEVADSSDTLPATSLIQSSAADAEDFRLRLKRKGDALFTRMGDAAMHCLMRSCVERNWRPEIKPSDSIRPENFLFEKYLLHCDTVMLFIPGEMVTAHFPNVGNSQDLVCLTFTDAQNKQWCMQIKSSMVKGFGTYIVVSGWEGFAKEYHLQYNDVVKFYKPDQALDWGDRQFLIDDEKRNQITTRIRKRRRGEKNVSFY